MGRGHRSAHGPKEFSEVETTSGGGQSSLPPPPTLRLLRDRAHRRLNDYTRAPHRCQAAGPHAPAVQRLTIMRKKKTQRHNLILLGVDSLWADHMSGYAYRRLTTPHIDRFASEGVLFERNYSPHIPTTSAYATMLTGMDCFSHQVVALRHQGGLTDRVRTLPEILREQGY